MRPRPDLHDAKRPYEFTNGDAAEASAAKGLEVTIVSGGAGENAGDAFSLYCAGNDVEAMVDGCKHSEQNGRSRFREQNRVTLHR